MGETPIVRLARWLHEPRARRCRECGRVMEPAARSARIFECSDECATAYMNRAAW